MCLVQKRNTRDVALGIAAVEKLRLDNLQLRSTLEAILFQFWMKWALVTMEMFVLGAWWFSNQFDKVSDTPCSCDAVDREVLWAILCSLLCYETDWHIRGIGKHGSVFHYKKWCFEVVTPDINLCQQLFSDWEKFKQINLVNVLFIWFVTYETKQ